METAKEKNENLPIMTQVRRMEVGEKLSFPIEGNVVSIRANLSTYGFMLNRVYRSHVNREERVIEIKREA